MPPSRYICCVCYQEITAPQERAPVPHRIFRTGHVIQQRCHGDPGQGQNPVPTGCWAQHAQIKTGLERVSS